jgi:hypothetical protein
MSMTQEEIEALMNESVDIDPATDDIGASEVVEEVSEDTSMTTEDIAGLIEEVESTSQNDIPTDDTADILEGIDGVTNDTTDTTSNSQDNSMDFDSIMNDQVNSGIYPLPVEKEHKVVNQLNEVAEDSEEKATKIFDVLSFILDENAEIQSSVKNIEIFIDQQISLLSALSTKFPNVSVIQENLASAKSLNEATTTICAKIDEENNQIFNAMDLMQFHDINRQKIERVMAVIRKLSTYLNGIFEDDSDKPEVQIAKHISGDSSSIVENDDLDALIAEFGN